jgi:hypothetical protein
MNIDSGTAFVLAYLLVNVGIAITCVLAALAIGWLFHWLRERHITRGLGPESGGPSQPYS